MHFFILLKPLLMLVATVHRSLILKWGNSLRTILYLTSVILKLLVSHAENQLLWCCIRIFRRSERYMGHTSFAFLGEYRLYRKRSRVCYCGTKAISPCRDMSINSLFGWREICEVECFERKARIENYNFLRKCNNAAKQL